MLETRVSMVGSKILNVINQRISDVAAHLINLVETCDSPKRVTLKRTIMIMVTVFHQTTFENFEYDCQQSAGPADTKYKPTSNPHQTLIDSELGNYLRPVSSTTGALIVCNRLLVPRRAQGGSA